jgi:hypothetical protein
VISRAEFIRELPIRLAGTKYEHESHAAVLSTGCIALLFGTNEDQVRRLMQGCVKYPVGNQRKYRVDDIFDTLKRIGVMTG